MGRKKVETDDISMQPQSEPYEVGDIPEFDKRPAFIHVLLLNKTIRLFFVLGVAGVVIPAFAYLFFFSKEIGHGEREEVIGTCSHPTLYHIVCGRANMSREECHSLGCCYTSLSTCYHSLPSEHQYTLIGEWANGAILTPMRQVTPYRKTSLLEVRLHIFAPQPGRFRFVLAKPNVTEPVPGAINLSTDDYTVRVYSPTFFIEVKRNVDNEVIFSTARGPLVITEDFIEWTLYIGADTLFGLGQAYLEPGVKYVLLNGRNHSAVPIVMGFNLKTKQFNGIVFSSPGLTEVEIIKSRLIVVRAQLGRSFEVQFLTGPSAEDLYNQLKSVLQNHYVPPFWAYGVHVCDQSKPRNVTVIKADVQRLINESIAFDSHCFHNDLFWISNTLAIDHDLDDVRALLKEGNKRFLPSLLLAVQYSGNPAYIDAREASILLRNSKNMLPYQALVRNRSAVYVDWLTERVELTQWFGKHWTKVQNLAADGYTLEETYLRDDHNKTYPISGSLTYVPDDLNDTLVNLVPWNILLSDQKELVLSKQNLLASAMLSLVQEQSSPDQLIVTNTHDIHSKAAIIASNVSSSWISLRNEVNRAIGLSIAGITFTGTPICGNAGDNTTEELCIRWYQFGSLLPLFKVTADRTPDRFSHFARRIMRATIHRRYSLLEYYNTIVISGEPYLRPMFYYYEKAHNFTTELWEQFMVGEALLVAPVLLPQMVQIAVYYPETFYELWAGQEMPSNDVLQYAVVESDLPMFLRPGYLVPLRDIDESVVSIAESRTRPLYLIGAYECSVRRWKCGASGTLHFTSGFQLLYSVEIDSMVKIQVNASVAANVDGTGLACTPDTRILSAEITTVRLYGHPNFSQPLEYDVYFDFCREQSITVEYVNEYRGETPAEQ